MGTISYEPVEARRLRPGPWWIEGVGDGGGPPVSSATEGHSLPVEQPFGYRASEAARFNAKHAWGQSQPGERLSLEAMLFKLGCRTESILRMLLFF
jgi:hypothetical protein